MVRESADPIQGESADPIQGAHGSGNGELCHVSLLSVVCVVMSYTRARIVVPR